MKTTTEYAVLIVLCLASYGGMRSAKDIAAFTGMPPATVVQVASKLRQARLIDSTRGHAGGYCLAGSPRGISLLDVVKAMEAREDVVACAPTEAPPSCNKLGSDPVSRRGAERLACAVQALSLVGLRMDGILREATLDRLVFGREGPATPDDFPARAATLGPLAAHVRASQNAERKERDYEANSDQ